jgi:hypothetical protein
MNGKFLTTIMLVLVSSACSIPETGATKESQRTPSQAAPTEQDRPITGPKVKLALPSESELQLK